MRDLDEVILSVEEVEALRLKDLECLDQEQSAERMNISRPTFQRVLATARQKIADALLRGKAIRIEGGNFEMAWRRFRCFNGHEWDMPFEIMAGESPEVCPACNTANIAAVQIGSGYGMRGSGRHRRARRGR